MKNKINRTEALEQYIHLMIELIDDFKTVRDNHEECIARNPKDNSFANAITYTRGQMDGARSVASFCGLGNITFKERKMGYFGKGICVDLYYKESDNHRMLKIYSTEFKTEFKNENNV